MDKQQFHIGDILSITTEYLLSPTQMHGVYNILNFMTRDDLSTLQLPRVKNECKPYLIKQFPWSDNLDLHFTEAIKARPFKDNADLMAWLEPFIAEHGEYFMVNEMPMDDHENISAEDEAVRLMGADRVITFNLDDIEPDEPSPYGDLPPKADR